MERFPAIPYAAWVDTKETLHRFAQVVGKIRLAASVRRNHWWHAPFHLTGRGITSRPMGDDPIFTIDFDFVDHRLLVHALSGRTVSFPLAGRSVASFYREVESALGALGISVDIDRPNPFDLPDAGRPFSEDTEHSTYDPRWVTRYWQVLSQVNLVLESFTARFSGKTSPVHHFWHTFDIAVTRYSDRQVDHPPDKDSVTREAYSREVISAGFWFGDEAFPEPAFYSYTSPEPQGLADEALVPDTARWVDQGGSHLAVLVYDDARTSDDPRRRVMDFLESAYQAGARLAGWDVERLSSPGGVTDTSFASRSTTRRRISDRE